MDYNEAYNRVKKLKKFYKNLIWFGIISAVIIGDDLFNNEVYYKIWGGHLILTIWALFLIMDAVSLFVFNDQWEKKIMENENRKNKKTIDF
ncbi:2TM domain-containing protein [Chryseobacterium sp.]|uniref:2TM domain-containing protein n=1 Tax=Chryseobacterium sp. TaxID=1871047 RepID=UPI00321B1CE6